MKDGRLPVFLGIGVQRAGTTWLHNCLAEHPEVCMSQPKETHFFYVNYDRGLDWYLGHFDHCPATALRGEICPDYLYHPEAMDRIQALLPDVRLIVVLRDPVDRAFSAYRIFRDQYPGLSFLEACRRDPALVDMGRYHRHLAPVYQRFGSDRILIFLYEDILQAPLAMVQKVYEFIGVDPAFVPGVVEKRFNQVMFPRTQRLLYGLGLARLVHWVRATPLGERLRQHASAAPAPRVSAAERDRLRPLFEEDLRLTETLVGRPLPW